MRIVGLSFISVLTIFFNLAYSADIYKCQNNDGTFSYSTTPCENPEKQFQGEEEEKLFQQHELYQTESKEPVKEKEGVTIQDVAEPSGCVFPSTLECRVDEVIDGDTFDCIFPTLYRTETRGQAVAEELLRIEEEKRRARAGFSLPDGSRVEGELYGNRTNAGEVAALSGYASRAARAERCNLQTQRLLN